MRILLVRHGESAGNVDPTLYRTHADHAVGLSERGKQQARDAGRLVAEFYASRFGDPSHAPHIRLWNSPYRRTRETAEGLLETCGGWIRDQREHILLCEQQFGLFDGIPDEELPKRFPNEFAHYEKCLQFEGRFWVRYPLGESRFDVATRVHQAFGTFYRDSHRGIRDLVVVCHGVTLRAFLMMWCHYTPEWFEKERNPGNCAIRLIDGTDRGFLFAGFREGAKQS